MLSVNIQAQPINGTHFRLDLPYILVPCNASKSTPDTPSTKGTFDLAKPISGSHKYANALSC